MHFTPLLASKENRLKITKSGNVYKQRYSILHLEYEIAAFNFQGQGQGISRNPRKPSKSELNCARISVPGQALEQPDELHGSVQNISFFKMFVIAAVLNKHDFAELLAYRHNNDSYSYVPVLSIARPNTMT